MVGEGLSPGEPEQLAQERVIPHLGVGVEREVVGRQREVGLE
jgi:hypothetical protein